MTITASGKETNWITYVFLIACLLLIAWCANPAQLYFLNDDFIHIPMAYDGTIGHHHGIRYMSDFSLYLDSLWSKEDATGYHITNLVLYIANMLLAIPLLKKITGTLGYPISTDTVVLMVSLFGVYAFHSEALFWILCRTASLSFFFNVLSWLCFFKALQRRWWVVPMIAFFLLGIFTYESLWVYPFWLLAWYFLLPKNSKEKQSGKVPIGVIWTFFIAYFPFRWIKRGELLGSYEATDIQEFHVLSVVVKSMKLFARSFLPPMTHSWLFVVFFIVILGLFAAFAWALWKKEKANRLLWFFGLAWLISYVPYVALGVSTVGYESERYLYYPSFFLCAFFVYGILLLWKNQPVKTWFILATVFAYHIFFQLQVSFAFKKISSYSKSSIKVIQSTAAGKGLILRDLPAYSYGIPIFNYGFKNAVRWLAPQLDTNNIIVESKKNFFEESIHAEPHSAIANDTIIFIGK